MSPLATKALTIAQSQIGVREVPPGSNRGPEVDAYQRSVGLNPEGKYSWCAAFVYYCFNKASIELATINPLVKTGGVLKHWNETHGRKILTSEVNKDTSLEGTIFVISEAGGFGHTGMVESFDFPSRVVTTVEGNTNEGGSREGIGVFRRKREIHAIKGFIDYSEQKQEPEVIS